MNQQRVTIWQGHLAASQARLVNVDTDFPAADASLRAKIRAGIIQDVQTAEGFIGFHSK